MLYDRTVHEIKYDSWATGPQGMRFKLYPVTGRNTPEQVREAKAALRREQDVVAIGLSWITLERWERMKVFFHPNATYNDALNEQYHGRFDRLYGEQFS